MSSSSTCVESKEVAIEKVEEENAEEGETRRLADSGDRVLVYSREEEREKKRMKKNMNEMNGQDQFLLSFIHSHPTHIVCIYMKSILIHSDYLSLLLH